MIYRFKKDCFPFKDGTTLLKSNDDMAPAHILNIFTVQEQRTKIYPLEGMTGFNQVVIKLQLILTITICDYDEEYDDDQDTRPNFKRGRPRPPA